MRGTSNDAGRTRGSITCSVEGRGLRNFSASLEFSHSTHGFRTTVREARRMRLLIILVVGLVVAGCGPHHRGLSIRRVTLSPSPQGPTLVVSQDSVSGEALLARVSALIPRPLPPNPSQNCHIGAVITIETRSESRSYGPCQWPAAVARARQVLLKGRQSDPARALAHTVPRAAWHAVLSDWYDGQWDSWHSCAAVREAIRHLPPGGGPIYSTVALDLPAYARGVC
jgi:hypothetical protein